MRYLNTMCFRLVFTEHYLYYYILTTIIFNNGEKMKSTRKTLIYGMICITILITIGFIGVLGEMITHQKQVNQPKKSDFKFYFVYGVGANILDTFNGTFTKDMVMDPPITVNLSLSEEAMKNIYQKMLDINFFNYPEVFSIPIKEGEAIGMVTPYSSYYFLVNYNGQIKRLSWQDSITNENEQATKLHELINLIINYIESTLQYQSLPPPNGGYI